MPNTDWKQVCAACAEGTPPERCVYYGDPDGCNAPTLGKHPEGNLAERLQEALEKAERRIAGLERATGSFALVRAALNQLRDWALLDINENAVRSDEPNYKKLVDGIVEITNTALAAPARNCDRFATVGAAHKAWRATDQERDFADWLFALAQGGAKCVNGLRGEPDCRGCNEHCEDVRKRNCFYWNPDIEAGVCALTGKKSCPISCDNFHIPEKVSPPREVVAADEPNDEQHGGAPAPDGAERAAKGETTK